MEFVGHLFAGIWAAGVLAAIWYVWSRPSPPVVECQEDKDLRDWLDGQV